MFNYKFNDYNFIIIIYTLFIYLFIYLFCAVLALHCYMGFSLVAESAGCFLALVCRLLPAVAFLVMKHVL